MDTKEHDYNHNAHEQWTLFEGGADPLTDPGAGESQQETPNPQDAGGNIYHVYMVKEPKEPHEEEAGHSIAWEEEDEHRQEVPDAAAWQRPHMRRRRVWFSLILASLLLVGLSAGIAVAYITQAPTASVTLIPTEQSITLHTSIHVATAAGSSTPAAQQAVPGRALPTMTLSQATTVSTSGTGHQDAQAAQGLLTFYNGLLQVQIVSAGTLLTSSSGIQVVTDEDALLPAASLPTSGQVTVSAHTLIFGPEGNIAAFSLSQPCCRENVYVQNPSAFHGGQLARSFPMVAKQDITAASTLLTGSLQQSVQAAMQPQIRSGETLITPLPCSAKVSSNHAIGEEAAQVTVSLDDICHGVVYQTAAMQHLMTQRIEQEALHRLGTGYSLNGAVHTEVIQVQQDQQQGRGGMISVEVKASGACTYQFSQQQIAHFKQLMAGKSKQEATRLLLAQPGVSTVSLEVKGRETETLPTETGKIAVLVMTPVA